MTRLNKLRLAIPSVAALLLSATPAFAQDVGGTDGTIGQLIGNILENLTTPIIFLISLVCALGGLLLVAKGLVKIKDASGNNAEVGSSLMIIAAGVMLFALPEMAGTGMASITSSSGIISQSEISKARADLDDPMSGTISFGDMKMGGVQDCYSKEKPVPCIAENIASNVVPVGIQAVFVLSFIAGLWGLGATLFELTKVQGGRGLPEGFVAKIVFNVLLMNASIIFQFTSGTLLGNEGTILGSGLVSGGSPLLKYNVGAGGYFEQYQDMVGHIFTILAFFGALAFARGLFVMKAAGEGKQGGTYGHGMVFVVAGVLLANTKSVSCSVLFTMGLHYNASFGFC